MCFFFNSSVLFKDTKLYNTLPSWAVTNMNTKCAPHIVGASQKQIIKRLAFHLVRELYVFLTIDGNYRLVLSPTQIAGYCLKKPNTFSFSCVLKGFFFAILNHL